MSVYKGWDEQSPDQNEQWDSWTHLRLDDPRTVNGWLAGPTQWLWTHHLGQTKPCLATMTHGELHCKGCEYGRRPEWKGYTPLYTEAGTGGFVIVRKEQKPVLDALQLYMTITVSRANTYHAPVAVNRSEWTRMSVMRMGLKGKGHDLRPVMVKVWALPQLTRWLAARDDASVRPAAAPTPGGLKEAPANNPELFDGANMRRLMAEMKKQREQWAREKEPGGPWKQSAG